MNAATISDVHVRAARCGQRARRGERQLQRADEHGDAHADRGAGGIARPTPRRSRGGQPTGVKDAGRQRAGRQRRRGRSRPPRRRAADCPCSVWSASTTPATRGRTRPERGRARREVPRRRRRLHHRRPLLQGRRQHRHAHRQPVDAAPARCWPRPRSPARRRPGWQQVNFATPVAITANTVYVASYFAPNGQLRRRQQLLRRGRRRQRRRCTRCRTASSGGNGVYAYGATSGFPTSTYQVDQLLGRRGVQHRHGAGRHHAADGDGDVAGERRDRRGARARRSTATFSEAMDAATVTATHLRAARCGQARWSPATVSLQRGHAHGDAARPRSRWPARQTYTATVQGRRHRARQGRWPAIALAAERHLVLHDRRWVAVRCTPANADRRRELPGRQPGERVGHHRRRRPEHPGLRDRHQRQPRRDGLASRSTPTPTTYRIDIYRLGYYGGLGARKVATVTPSAHAAADPAGLPDATPRPA